MSRSIGRLLLLLALWVQILAPVAAVQAVLAADDPLAGMTICGHVAGDVADDPAEGAADHRAVAPPLCGLCCAALAVLDAAPPETIAVALVWRHHAFAAPADASNGIAGPGLPRARDPPVLA